MGARLLECWVYSRAKNLLFMISFGKGVLVCWNMNSPFSRLCWSFYKIALSFVILQNDQKHYINTWITASLQKLLVYWLWLFQITSE